MTKLKLPTGDTITLSDEADGDAALDAITNYAEEEAERLAGETEELEAQIEKQETKIAELSDAKELLVDEVCRRMALSEDSFDPQDDRETVAALSVEELESKLDGLPASADADDVVTSDTPTTESGVYAFAQ